MFSYSFLPALIHRTGHPASLAARYLDICSTWKENQGEELITVCIEVRPSLLTLLRLTLGQIAKLHPCLYDYDAFWSVHNHMKRYLLSMGDRYNYADPDLVHYDAEAAARGEVRPLLRKKRHTSNENQERNVPRSPSPSNREVLLSMWTTPLRRLNNRNFCHMVVLSLQYDMTRITKRTYSQCSRPALHDLLFKFHLLTFSTSIYDSSQLGLSSSGWATGRWIIGSS